MKRSDNMARKISIDEKIEKAKESIEAFKSEIRHYS